MQNMLRMIGFGENLGTGFPTMVAAWEKKFHTLPKLKDNLQINFTELTFSGMKNNGENTTAITSNKLTKRQQLIVAIIKQEPSISAKSIAEKIADMIADGSADKIAASFYAYHRNGVSRVEQNGNYPSRGR